jgi:hypothetical protein
MSHVVRYRVPASHHAETVRGEQTLRGSIYHHERTEFTGLVTHSHEDGTHDIVIFPPDKAPQHVERVAAGEGDGTLSFTGDEEPKPGRPEKRGRNGAAGES